MKNCCVTYSRTIAFSAFVVFFSFLAWAHFHIAFGHPSLSAVLPRFLIALVSAFYVFPLSVAWPTVEQSSYFVAASDTHQRWLWIGRNRNWIEATVILTLMAIELWPLLLFTVYRWERVSSICRLLALIWAAPFIALYFASYQLNK